MRDTDDLSATIYGLRRRSKPRQWFFKNEFLNTIIFIYAKMLFVKIHEDPFISIFGLR